MKKYRIFLANRVYFGTYHMSKEALRRWGATVKGNCAYFH